MNFNTRVTGAYWDAEKGEWRVTLSQAMPDGTKREFEDRCHVLLNATGILNNYKWPDLEGIDKFRGRVSSQIPVFLFKVLTVESWL